MKPAPLTTTVGLSFVMLCSALAQTSPSPTPAASPASSTPQADNSPLAPLKAEQEKLSLENGIAQQQLQKELAKLTAEKQRLELESSVAMQKSQNELASLREQIAKLSSQTELLEKQSALREAQAKDSLDQELADLRKKLERDRLANEFATLESGERMRILQQHDLEMQIKLKELQAERDDFQTQLAKLNAQIDLREKKDVWRNRVDHEIQYTKEPFQNGVLTISDRRIALNDVIMMDTADYVAERIDYFNNQSQEYPIFIVIDSSPGGSVMAGYKILKAMEGSPAPVYVVVKSFAASMAAGITTLSKRSFAYPNAIILHHQMTAGSFGNVTQQKEHLAEIEQWWTRLATPVAQKMGLSLDQFIQQMYKNRSTGDWQEFADNAKKLKWVDEVVDDVRETSFIKSPDNANGDQVRRQSRLPLLEEKVDPNGKRYISLPRLNPTDCYYLYNPDEYYRFSQ